jgi:hypothetical protein
MGGIPGPPPKKDAERRRRNKTPESSGSLSSIPAEVVNIDELLVGEVEIPLPDEEWHDIAIMIYESVMKSGQVIWMEPSDWAALYLMCESISRDLNPQVVGITEDGDVVKDSIPLKGASLSSYLKGFAALMMTEGDRRRLRIELERKKRLDAAAEGGGNVVDIVQKRADAFKGA